MAKGKEIKGRIKSIGSMLQVTKAMELIASIKMRKAQESAIKSKRYVFDGWKTILKISSNNEEIYSKYTKENPEGKILALLITSDKGLAGSYNSDILKKTLQFIEQNGLENIDFVTMGEKGKKFIRKIGGNIVADYTLGQKILFSRYSPIVHFAVNGFESKQYRKFVSLHTHFQSAAKTEATSLQILPLHIDRLVELQAQQEIKTAIDYKLEPTAEQLIEAVVRQITRALTYQVILESEAAEHAARMIAMRNASDAAKDLKKEFEFTYNQLRQSSITQELAEISAGVNSMEQ
jgi:F-type H+-transporting ATPase subunit gamma